MTTLDEQVVRIDGPAATPAAPPRVGELAERRLRGNPDLALQNLSCDYRDGVLTLRGRVPTYYLLQAAQAAVDCLENVSRVVNQIEVAAPAPFPWAGRV